MRGCSGLLASESVENQTTGVFLASAEPNLIANVVSRLSVQFPNVCFTCIAPESYRETICFPNETVSFEDVKKNPLHWLRELRRRRFDICVAVFAGGPSFRKWKLVPFFLNTQRIFVYSENGTSLVLGWSQWKNLYRHLKARRKQWPSTAWFFAPFGFCFLLARTAWIVWQARLRRSSRNSGSSNVSQPGARK